MIIEKTREIGQGWYMNFWTDGSVTIRNSDKGVRIDLSPEQADRVAEIFETVRAKHGVVTAATGGGAS